MARFTWFLLIAACAGRPAPLRLPEVALPLTDRYPPAPAPERAAPFDSEEATRIRLFVDAGGETVALEGWCRVDVWTTLEHYHPTPFAVRESWGRLGTRPPKLLARLEEDLGRGITARLRPRRDGTLEYRIEVGDGVVGEEAVVGIFYGKRISLPRPVRRGFFFAGAAPGNYRGPLAAWQPGVTLRLGEDPAPPAGTLTFTARGSRGFVVGSQVRAETFREEWKPAEPVFIDADGVERGDFRLVVSRRTAGFQVDASDRKSVYGGSGLEFGFGKTP